MNAEYIKHFPQECIPARVCYGGVDLAAGCKIEIVAIAKKA
jgi:enamine deaminase RidA (YjgF/YER057c/UK114 family)